MYAPLLFALLLAVPPLGLDLYRPVPEDNPLTKDRVTLGRKLFFDKRLSRDGSMACATCHDVYRDIQVDGKPAGIEARCNPKP